MEALARCKIGVWNSGEEFCRSLPFGFRTPPNPNSIADPAPIVPRLVMPRPEGRRCLVIAAHGSTAVRTRTGVLLGRFPSCLPGGSRSSSSGADFTVVDAVLVERELQHGHLQQQQGEDAAPQGMEQEQQEGEQQQRQLVSTQRAVDDDMGQQQQQQLGQEGGAPHGMHREREQQHHDQGHEPGRAHGGGSGSGGGLPPGSALFLSDVIAWRGVMLAGCSAECRAFWLASKMAECATPGPQGGSSWPTLHVLPALPATPEGLESAVHGECSGSALGFVQDGVCLMHREGRYTPGYTPLALLWKDETCSRYLLVGWE